MKIPRITIVSFEHAEFLIKNNGKEGELGKIDYHYLVSIGSEWGYGVPKGYEEFEGAKIRLQFDDMSYDSYSARKAGYKPPSEAKIVQLIDFYKQVIEEPKDILIHCAMGESRSSAAALVLLAMIFGEGKEKEAVEYLRNGILCEHKPYIHPNALIVNYADKLLERDGKLTKEYIAAFS